MKIKLKVTLLCIAIFCASAKTYKNDDAICSFAEDCKTCGNEEELKMWSQKKATMYGGTFQILNDLKKKEYKNFDKYFFENYGAFIFSLHTSKKRNIPNKRETIEFLLDNGVHPYMRIIEGMSLIENAISRGDKELFKLIVDRNILKDCINELNGLIDYTKKLNDSYFIDYLQENISN